MHNRTNKLIEFQHNHRLPHWIINIFLTYNESKKKLSKTYTKTTIVSMHPISHFVAASMRALWSMLGSTFSAVSSFDGAFHFLFVLITCRSLIFPMLKTNVVINIPLVGCCLYEIISLLNLSFCTLQTSPSRLTIFFQSCNRLTPSCTWRKHYYM